MHVYNMSASLSSSFWGLFLCNGEAGLPHTGNILFYKKGAAREDFPFSRTYILLRGFGRFLAKLVPNYGIAIQKTLDAKHMPTCT